MGKRKLSRQQRNRIDEAQARRQRSAESTSENDGQANTSTGDHQGGKPALEIPGRVICHFGQQLDVESLLPEHNGEVVRCHQRANLPALVTGDQVVWQRESDTKGVVVALSDRANYLARPNSRGELRPVAANIDLVCIVFAAIPQPFPSLIDRYLVAAELLELNPVLVLNKVDLKSTERENIDNILSIFRNLPYPIFEVSAQSEAGMNPLRDALKGKTAVFVGQSGVGKSSLINALEPADQALVGDLSEAADKGTHTTTASRLFHCTNCDLIDSPGIREFGLWHVEIDQLMAGFVDLSQYSGGCKFRDCRHENTPGCALEAAALQGLIDPRRLASYLQIRQHLENNDKSDY